MSITCQVCATVNPDTAQFCDGCGVELTPQASPAASSPLPTDMAQTDSPQTDAAQLSPAPLESDAGVAPAEALPDANTQGAADLTGEAASLDSGLSDMPVSDEAVENADGSARMAQEASPEALPAAEQQVSGDSSAMTGEALETAAMPAPEEASTQPSSPELMDAAASAAAVAVSAEQRTGPARLGVRKFGAPTGDFIPLQGERLVVGRFDASSGPVDIDLAALGGAEHISRRHAELSQQGGRWTVTDLGSTNGVFIKRAGQGAFSPRLQEPTPLSDGDEVAFGNLVLTFHQD